MFLMRLKLYNMRESGYYWINFGFPRIGLYNNEDNTWLLIGMDLDIRAENVEVLNKNVIKYEKS